MFFFFSFLGKEKKKNQKEKKTLKYFIKTFFDKPTNSKIKAHYSKCRQNF